MLIKWYPPWPVIVGRINYMLIIRFKAQSDPLFLRSLLYVSPLAPVCVRTMSNCRRLECSHRNGNHGSILLAPSCFANGIEVVCAVAEGTCESYLGTVYLLGVPRTPISGLRLSRIAMDISITSLASSAVIVPTVTIS